MKASVPSASAPPIAQLYDAEAATYDYRYRRNTDRAEDRVLYDYLRPYANGRKVLDVCCGTGAALDHLAPSDWIGVDASAKMLERAGARLGDMDVLQKWARLEHGDWCEFDSTRFFQLDMDQRDLVFCLWGFSYLTDQPKALRLMRDAVRPGGHVIVHGYSRRYAERPHYVLNGKGPELITPTTPHKLEQLARGAGLLPLRVVGFRYLLDPPLLDRLPIDVLAKFFRTKAEHLPPSLAGTHLLFARRPMR